MVTKPDTRELIRKGALKRREAGLNPKHPTDIGKQISHIAGKHNVVIEWTVRPLDHGEVAACACTCSHVCTCYAVPHSHSKVVLEPARLGQLILDGDNVNLGALFDKKK